MRNWDNFHDTIHLHARSSHSVSLHSVLRAPSALDTTRKHADGLASRVAAPDKQDLQWTSQERRKKWCGAPRRRHMQHRHGSGGYFYLPGPATVHPLAGTCRPGFASSGNGSFADSPYLYCLVWLVVVGITHEADGQETRSRRERDTCLSALLDNDMPHQSPDYKSSACLASPRAPPLPGLSSAPASG